MLWLATGTEALAVSLGVVGAILSALVTLIGILVKYSIDDRNAELAAVAEKRNRIEAAVRAVDLLGENNPHQVGGALLALVSLGELELAVSLLASIWPAGLVSAHAAGVVVEKSLIAGSEEVKDSAAVVLSRQASQIGQDGYNIWPIPSTGWRTDLPDNCRLGLIHAAAEWMIVELKKSSGPDSLPVDSSVDPTLVLIKALDDPHSYVRVTAAACLRPLRDFLPETAAIPLGTTDFLISEIDAKLTAIRDETRTRRTQGYEDRVRDALKLLEIGME